MGSTLSYYVSVTGYFKRVKIVWILLWLLSYCLNLRKYQNIRIISVKREKEKKSAHCFIFFGQCLKFDTLIIFACLSLCSEGERMPVCGHQHPWLCSCLPPSFKMCGDKPSNDQGEELSATNLHRGTLTVLRQSFTSTNEEFGAPEASRLIKLNDISWLCIWNQSCQKLEVWFYLLFFFLVDRHVSLFFLSWFTTFYFLYNVVLYKKRLSMPTYKIWLFFINVFVWMNIRSAWLYVYLNLMMLYLSGQTNNKKLKSFPNGQLPNSAFSLEEVFCTNELCVRTNSSLTKVDAIIWKILHVLYWRSQPCGWHPSATKTSSASPPTDQLLATRLPRKPQTFFFCPPPTR